MSSDSTYRDPQTMSFDLVKNRVLVDVDDAEEAREWLAKAETGDFIVRLEQRLVEGAEVDVLLRAGALEVPLRCVVKQVFRSGMDRHGTMLEWLERDGGLEAADTDVSTDEAAAEEHGSARPPAIESEPSWTEVPVEESEIAEPTLMTDGEPDPNLESASGAINLTRRIPDPAPAGAQMFDVSALNPEEESEALVQGSRDPSAGEVPVEVADRGADELEALLNESGTWRRKTIESAIAGAADAGGGASEQDAPAEERAEEELEEQSPGEGAVEAETNGTSSGDHSEGASMDPGLTPEAQQAVVYNETRGVSLAHTIGAMNPNEKARLAVRGSRQERRLLLRDHTFSVQMGLLNNPRTENKEILEIAANPQTTGGILKRLASDRKWASNYEVQMALVKHPGTPSPLAIRLLGQVRISDLRMFAKSQALRENVRKAALRLYLQRSE